MKKAKEHIRKRAKDAKATIHQALRSRPQSPSPSAGDEAQRVAETHDPPSASGLLAAEAQLGAAAAAAAAARTTEEQYLSPEPIEDASRAMTSMHILKSSHADTIGDTAQSIPDSSTINAFDSLVKHLDVFSGLVDAISDIHPYAKMALSIFKAVTTVVTSQIQRDAALTDLLSTISDVYGYVNRYGDVEELDARRKTLLRKLSLQTVECAYFVRDQAKVKEFYKRAVKNALRGPSVNDQITAYNGIFDSIRRHLTETGVLEIEIRVLRSLSDVGDSIELLSFTHVRGAGYNSAKGCLPDTRTGILDDLSAWVNDPSTTRLRFLVGNAGRGKSAIAHSLAIRFDALCRLGCFFAFDKSFQLDRHPESVLPTIAHELAGWNPDFKHSLASILRERPSLTHTTDIAVQWDELIVRPAKQVTLVGQVLIVIDAFDESNPLQHSSRRLLLEQLTEGVDMLPDNFRILITSRPEADVVAKLERHADSSVVDSVDLDNYTFGVAGDMLRYIRHTIKAHEFSMEELDEDQVKQLADKSEGLFQWAATACRAISANPAGMTLSERFEERLGAILHGGPSSLDSLYSGILQQIFPSESVAVMTRFRSVMAQILCAAEPISSDTLQSLRSSAGIGQKNDVSLVVRYMGALLSGVDNATSPIRPLHTSFRDFLADKSRSNVWYVDTQDGHSTMLLGSAATLYHGVRFNICNISTSYRRNSDVPGLRDRVTSPALVYAATYLKDHISISSKDPPMNAVLSALQDLFCKKLLLWFELLSVLGCLNTAPLVLQRVALLFPDAGYESTRAALQDAIRFVQLFAFPISQSAPHVYLSALSFSPKSSITRQAFISQFPHIPAIAVLINLWPRLQYVLEDVHFKITTVAWSHDGHYIATGSPTGEISTWHASTGRPAQKFPQVHSGMIYSIQFSPDDRRIVSGSSDSTVQIWDVATGGAIRDLADNHSDEVMAVAYSPDGRFIASASADSTVHIRNSDPGSTVHVLDRHCPAAKITSLAFSTDGRRLIVGATDHTLCIWDVARFELIGEPLRGHSDTVWSICCSPNGRRIVSGSGDHTLRIWDIDDGTPVGEPLCGHSSPVFAVAYSPDGRLIVSSSGDSTIRVWDAKSRTAIKSASRSRVVWRMAYSPDGHRIALGSLLDGDVHIWDADMLETDDNPSETYQSSPVNAVVYSPDGSRIASCSDDGKIRVYNAANGELIGEPFVGHTDTPVSISYSPDGRHIVSGGTNTMVCIWDADTSELIVIANASGVGYMMQCVAYSPNGQQIIWGGEGICVYNAETHEVIEKISGGDSGHDTCTVSAIAYSPNGQRFVSGSEDGALRVWDAYTRKQIGKPLEGHSAEILAVAFSPEGYHMVSGSNDCDLRIWNADTLEPVEDPLRGHTYGVTSVAYSPDGRQIVSGSYDLSVRLWDAKTGEAIGAPFYGHSSIVSSVSWSPDGQFVVSGSRDSTMRIWEVEPEHTEEIDSENVVQVANKSSMNRRPLLNFRHPAQELSRQSDINTNYSSQPRWSESEDGWIVDGSDNLLIWVPHEYRLLLSWPRTRILIAGTAQRVTIDFAEVRHGTEWAMCIDHGGKDHI